MPLILIGTDHRQAPVVVRERLAFGAGETAGVLKALHARPEIEEVVLVDTCNRVEFYVAGPEPEAVEAALCRFLVQERGVDPDVLAAHVVRREGEAVVRHLFRVASGLESLVPGEKQILGQVRDAIQAAREANTAGPLLNRLFDHALACGRRVRAETGIDRHPVSLSHAAVHLARQHFGSLEGRSFLLIGSGKMGTIAAGLLQKAGVRHFVIASRTLAHACQLARRWNARPLVLQRIPAVLAEVDAVISATAAPHFILKRADVEETIRQRSRPLLLVDLAVPRDIEPSIGELPGVTLVDVDGLQSVVEHSLALRHGAKEMAERIIAEEVDEFLAWCATREVVPTITALRQQAEAIRQAEVERLLRRLGSLTPKERQIVEAFSRRLVNQLLHVPTVRLREKAANGQGALYRQVAEDLFGLRNEGEEACETPAPALAEESQG